MERVGSDEAPQRLKPDPQNEPNNWSAFYTGSQIQTSAGMPKVPAGDYDWRAYFLVIRPSIFALARQLLINTAV